MIVLKTCAECGLKKDLNIEGLCIECSIEKHDIRVIEYVEPKIKEYHSRLETPLAFHNFNRYFAIPVGIITLIIRFYNEFTNITDYNWLYIVDFIYYTLLFALTITAFVGFLKWQLYGYKSFFSYLLLQLSYYLYSIIVYIAYGLLSEISTILGSLVGVLIYIVPVRIYYKKRKLLFAPYYHKVPTTNASVTSPDDQVKQKQPISPNHVEPQIMYCRKCGTTLPSSNSLYCNKCGTVVITAVHDKEVSI